MKPSVLISAWLLACAASIFVGAELAPRAAHADAELDKPQSLQIDTPVFTRESIVEVGGKKYRKIEFKSHVVYMQLLEAETTATDLQLLCEQEGKQVFNSKTTPLLVSAVKVTRRSSLFVEGLKQVCTEIQGGRKKISLEPSVFVGFLWHNDDESRALLKNKRVFFNPLNSGLGFKADW